MRAVRNLLDNAFAVADTVVIEATETANGPTISVTDNGPGVSRPGAGLSQSAKNSHEFDPFDAASRCRNRTPGVTSARSEGPRS